MNIAFYKLIILSALDLFGTSFAARWLLYMAFWQLGVYQVSREQGRLFGQIVLVFGDYQQILQQLY